MRGLNLCSLRLDLHKVEPDSEEPSNTITDWEKKLGPWTDWIRERYDESFDFRKKYHNLPLKALVGFSFDELCKLYYSSVIMMDRTVTDLFETRAQYEVIRKIESSMWRWGYSKSTWNEVVDAYDNIRRFKFTDDSNFELRLDHSTYVNPFGYSKYSRVYIDGAFAFLVYYKRKHVMTIGFSVLAGRKVLIQQVQAAQRSGNRYLFKLPKNRIEFAVDLFAKNFPGYALFVVDGGSLADKTLADYRHGLQQTQESLRRWESSFSPEYLRGMEEECEQLKGKITHLEADKPRLAATYHDVGRYRLGTKKLTTLNISHHPILLQPSEILPKPPRFTHHLFKLKNRRQTAAS